MKPTSSYMLPRGGDYESLREQEPKRIAVETFTAAGPFSNIAPSPAYYLRMVQKFKIPIILFSLLTLVLFGELLFAGVGVDEPLEQPSLVEGSDFEADYLQLKIPAPPASSLGVDTDPRRYGIIMDAGSSGTRVYVYSWVGPVEDAKPQDVLVSIDRGNPASSLSELKQEPGLSSFQTNPAGVGEHLDPLLKFAYDIIPLQKQSSTPLFLFATAGMRLVPQAERNQILELACQHTRKHFVYHVGKCSDHFRVISGELEGIFGWLTVNYLKTQFRYQHDADAAFPKSFGFIDMGGASAQIAFEPTAKLATIHGNDLKQVTIRKDTGQQQTHNLFVTTFLGFGANRARERYVERYTQSGQTQWTDPCVSKGLEIKSGTLTVQGSGQFQQCFEKITPLLNKELECPDNPCLFNGVHAPIEDFRNHHFLGVSELWYTTSQVYDLGGPYSYEHLRSASEKLCELPWSNITAAVESNVFPHVGSLSRMKLHCFKSAYLLNVLHEGLRMPKDTHLSHSEGPILESIDDIGGVSVSWTLGAMILYVSSTIPQASYSPSARYVKWTSAFVVFLILGLLWYLYSRFFQLRLKQASYINMTDFHPAESLHGDNTSAFDSPSKQRNAYWSV
ncbi:Golgi apyrase [Kappamyces sp. JEL0829]|nr:Golgi apyrase [Kappamyces sp. JEL0829]